MNRASRTSVCLLVGVGVLSMATCSCSSKTKVYDPFAHTETLSESADEHYHRVYRIEDQERRLLQEDLDLLFQTDRSTRLTRWHTK